MSNLEKKKRASVALIEDSKLTFSSLQIIKAILRQPINLIRSSLIGVFVGALPGAGGAGYVPSTNVGSMPSKPAAAIAGN